MTARPKISRNEWNMASDRSSKNQRRPAGPVRVTLEQPPAIAACRAFSSSLADGLERRRRGATGASARRPISHPFPAQARPTRAGSRAARRGAAPSRPTSPARAAACPGGGASRATTTSPSAARARRRTPRTRPAGSSTSTPAARPTRRSATSRRGKRPRGRRRRRPGDRPCSTCFASSRANVGARRSRPGSRSCVQSGRRRRRRSKAPSRSPPSVGRGRARPPRLRLKRRSGLRSRRGGLRSRG